MFAVMWDDEEEEEGANQHQLQPVPVDAQNVIADEIPGPERVFRDRLDPLSISDRNLLKKYRFRRHLVMELIELLRPDLERNTERSHAIPVQTIVLSSLRLLATGSFQNVVSDIVGVSQSSVSRTFKEFLHAMLRRKEFFISFNINDEDFIKTSKEIFLAIKGIPDAIFLIDCTHVCIKLPSVNGQIYINRKRAPSINTQIVVGARKQILDIVAQYPGSVHDSRIYANCGFREKVNTWNGIGYGLGDGGYPLEKRLMTPFRKPSTRQEENYNKALSTTRVKVEHVNGLLKMTFRAIDKSGGCLQYEPRTACEIITVCALLYNYRLMNNIQEAGLEDDRRQRVESSSSESSDSSEDEPEETAIQIRRKLTSLFPQNRHL